MNLLHALQQLGHPRLLVVGDVMLDRYVWGDVERVSQEAPILVLNANRQEDRLGGAANVAHMLHAFGAEVSVLGLLGQDADGQLVRQLFTELGIDHGGLVSCDQRCTTVKQRFVGRASGKQGGQVLRVDYEHRKPLDQTTESQLLALLPSLIEQQEAVLISDYGKGTCTELVVRTILHIARAANIPVLVDPIRAGDYSRYRGATLLKPNRYEAAQAAGMAIAQIDDARQAAQKLQTNLELDQVVITLDRDGMLARDKSGQEHHLATDIREVYDITGAGDMSFAMLGMGIASGISLPQCVALANLASGWEVQQEGVAVISREQLADQLQSQRKWSPASDREQLARVVRHHKAQGKKIVFTNGCFDLLHVGHVTYLQEAAQLGDILIVAVNSDQSVRKLKGPTRPVIQEADRAAMLAALACVDYVVVFEEDTPCNLLHLLKPDVLVKGGTYRVEEVVGHEIVTAYGGQVVLANVVDGVSTTRIVESLRRAA